jgi:hypothetical protein
LTRMQAEVIQEAGFPYFCDSQHLLLLALLNLCYPEPELFGELGHFFL